MRKIEFFVINNYINLCIPNFKTFRRNVDQICFKLLSQITGSMASNLKRISNVLECIILKMYIVFTF